MADKKIFVGRKDELEQFRKVLEDPKGQAVVVVGQAGMGKTWLVNEMVRRAELGILSDKTKNLKCWSVRYEITPNDAVTSTMERIIIDAGKAASPIREKLGMTGKHKEKWKALFGAGEVIPVFGKSIKAFGELVLSFGGKTGSDTRANFIKAINKLSECITNKERAIFIIDPEKLMPEKSDHDWGVIVRDLPNKIKLIFPQRTQDVLVTSDEFCALENVRRIPEENLDVLDDKAIDDLLYAYSKITNYSVNELQDVVSKYKGHPYAIAAALELLKAGEKPENLPKDPGGIAAAQWNRICESGDDAVHMFEAYAILEVGVPDDVVEAVSGLGTTTRKRLQKDKYLRGLLREEGEGRRIYHAILADYIVGQIGEDEKKEVHEQAVEVYRKHLDYDIKRENLSKIGMAANRLPEHVMKSGGKRAFVDTVINECFDPLWDLGELEIAKRILRRALETDPKEGTKVSAIVRNLTTIYMKQGKLNTAEMIITKDLETARKEEREEDIRHYNFMLAGIFQKRGQLDEAEELYKTLIQDAKKSGKKVGGGIFINLGIIHWRRGNFKEAANMQRKALRAHAKSKNKEGMVEAYGNFGAIYLSEGNLERAAYATTKALNMTNRVGVIASMCSNLAMIHMTCGNMDEAENSLEKTITINMGMGNIEGVARDLANLGSIYRAKGEIEKARETWIKSRDGYNIIGMKDMAEKVKGWLRELKG